MKTARYCEKNGMVWYIEDVAGKDGQVEEKYIAGGRVELAEGIRSAVVAAGYEIEGEELVTLPVCAAVGAYLDTDGRLKQDCARAP
jgi:hypothetical protein